MNSKCLAFVLIPLMLSPVVGQERNSDALWIALLAQQPKRISFSVDFNGQLHLHNYTGPHEGNFDIEEFFIHPLILADLRVSSAQEGQLRAALESRTSGWRARISQPLIAEDRESKLSELSQLEAFRRSQNADLSKRVRSILTTSQFARLRQIQLRFLINQNGFSQTLGNEKVRSVLGAPAIDVERFRGKQRKLALEITKENKELARREIDEWLSEFSGEQRKNFDDRWNVLLDHAVGSQQLILQLDPNMEEIEVEDSDALGMFSQWPCFLSDAAGRCVSDEESESKTSQLPATRLNSIHHLLFSRHFQRDIELIPSQLARLRSLAGEYDQQKLAANHAVGKKYRIAPLVLLGPSVNGVQTERVVYTLSTPAQLEDFQESIGPVAEVYFQKYLEVLMPHQRNLLRAVVANTKIRSHGPLAECLWGDLGEVLGLNESQKQSLKMRAGDAQRRLVDGSRQIYESAMEELIALAPASDQAEIRKLIGENLEGFHPCLDSFAVALLSTPDSSRPAD